MIKIRYLDLPTGLHVCAEASGSDTIIYLLPGLTTAQRRAALHRARSSARMGHGPALPAAGLACAVAADRMRTTVRNGAAAMRVHPGLVIPPVVITVSAALAYLLLASVAVTYRPPGAGPGQQPRQVSHGFLPPGGAPDVIRTPAARGRAGGHRGGPGLTPGSPPRRGPSPSPSPHRTPPPSPSPSAVQPSPQPSPSIGPTPSPSPRPSPAPSPSPSPDGVIGCVTIGQVAICAH